MNFDIKEVKIEIYIPEEYIEEIRNALTLAGACRAGNYDHVLSYPVSYTHLDVYKRQKQKTAGADDR